MAVTKEGATSPHAVLIDVVEPRRKQMRLSLRAAADRANMSEGTWRQLVAGGVKSGGNWIARHPRRDQVLDMALAVDALESVADLLDAGEVEVRATRQRVHIPDPAEEEIMGLRHIGSTEKLLLLGKLEEMRETLK